MQQYSKLAFIQQLVAVFIIKNKLKKYFLLHDICNNIFFVKKNIFAIFFISGAL